MLARFPSVPSLAEVHALRERHLDGLIAAQDALLEILVRDGRVHHIVVRDEVIGYAVVQDTTVLEFFVVPERDYYAHMLLPRLAEQVGIDRALVKTFDHVFLTAALFNSTKDKVGVRGVLVRDYVKRELPAIARIEYIRRTARPDDLPAITAVEQQIFTNAERLRWAVDQGYIELFERPTGGPLIGFGLMRPVIDGRPDTEVGVVVDPVCRNKGYAMYMLRDMVEHCLDRGLVPVSGCARTNAASIRMGTRIGFTGRYLLLEVEL
jgi:ribosomal protein S18 acetylase RimI-like enzyme